MGAGRQAGQSHEGCPAPGSPTSGFSSCEARRPLLPCARALPSAHPIGLDFAVCFPPVLLPTARLLELELQPHKLPGREELPTDKRKPAAQLSRQSHCGCDLSLLPSGQQHTLGRGPVASLESWAACWGPSIGAPALGGGARSGLSIPVPALPSLGWRSPCLPRCPRWSPGRPTARADACGTPPGPPAGPGAGPS